MKPPRFLLLGLAGCAATAGLALGQGGGAGQGAEFELRVGDTTYPIAAGQPFTITTPRGEKLQAILRLKESLHFSDHGITFDYPRQMKAEAEKDEGLVTITLEARESPLILIQLYPPGAEPAAVRQALVDGLRKEFAGRGGQVRLAPGRPARRGIGGTAREGTLLEIALAGQKLQAEVYAFSRPGGTLAVVLQHDLEDAALARRYFPVVTDSLR